MLHVRTDGAALRERRLSVGLTQESLAAAIGMSAAMVASLERGRRDLSLTGAVRAAAVLRCTVEDLIVVTDEADR